MKNFLKLFLESIVISISVVWTTTAGGYQINEQGARAVGMGGAFAARASDPSAIYFNPAGLTSQNGINLLMGGNLIIPSTTFRELAPSTNETSMKSQVFTPINLYGTYRLNEKIVLGLGVFNPFGLGTEWPKDWVGRLSSVKADIQTWYINPSIGYKVNDQLSVGIGVSYVYGSVKLIQAVQPTFGTATLDGTGSGVNFNLGIIYKPTDKLSLGLSYRTTTKIEFSGNIKFTEIPSTMAPFLPGGTGKATLPMPGTLLVGVAYEITEELTLEGDLQYIQWAEYDKLSLDIQPAVYLPAGPPYYGAMTQGPESFTKDWVDNVVLRGGAEYKLNEQATIRGGVILDLTPQPPSKTEPMLPDADRVDISIGGSYKLNDKITVDLAYMLVLFMERDASKSSLPGIYNSTAHIFSVNIGYSF